MIDYVTGCPPGKSLCAGAVIRQC